MSEVYLFNLVKSWIDAKHLYDETNDSSAFHEVAWYETRIENLVKQIERERYLKSHPIY